MSGGEEPGHSPLSDEFLDAIGATRELAEQVHELAVAHGPLSQEQRDRVAPLLRLPETRTDADPLHQRRSA